MKLPSEGFHKQISLDYVGPIITPERPSAGADSIMSVIDYLDLNCKGKTELAPNYLLIVSYGHKVSMCKNCVLVQMIGIATITKLESDSICSWSD